MAEIKDFGNKIGGAKKDLWRARGLMLDDIIDMNDIERNQYIKKDNVWQKPDYQEMVNQGLSKRVVYFIKTIRDGLPAKPQGNSEEYQKGYISFISDIRDKTMSITTEKQILSYYEDVMCSYREGRGYFFTPLSSTYGCINNKVLKASQIRNLNSLDREIKRKQFLYSDEEKILDKYIFFKYENITWTKGYNNETRMDIKVGGTSYVYPKNEFAIESNWQPDTYFVLDARHNIILNNVSSLDEAKRIIIEAEKKANANKAQSNRKKKFIPKQLQHIERVGDNYRNIHNITTDDMLNVFGFYGGEFGNWLNEKDKQQNLNYSYDAFVDLAKALNISNKDITFNGELSIAYGARGSAGAVAHYEPARKVINLTKMAGAGSLAHEWGHALDHYLSRCFKCNDTYITDTNNEIIKPLIEVMKYKIVDGEEAKDIHQKEYAEYRDRYIPVIKYYCDYNKLTDEQKKTMDVSIENCLNNHISLEEYATLKLEGKDNWALKELSEKVKEFVGQELSKSEKEGIASLQYSLTEKLKKFDEPVKVETDYYQNSKAMDGVHSKEDKGYWQSNVEMFARAFACYIKDKLDPNRSDYLCGHAESCTANICKVGEMNSKFIKAYPEGEERKSINECFDKLIEIVKDKGLFAEYNQENVIFNIHQNRDDIDYNFSNNDFEQTSFFELDNEPDICDDMF